MRYVIRPPGNPCDPAMEEDAPPAPPLPHPTVFQSEPVKTGLLDGSGNPIYRLPDVIGFLPHEDKR